MENQFNYNMLAMPLCWPTYILRHFLDILQPTCGCLELKDAESAKCKKSSDLQPRGVKTKRRPAIWVDPDPDFASQLQPLIGWQAAASTTPTPESTSWLVFVNFRGFLSLFDLTSLEILIDSQLNIIANWLKGFKRFNIIFTFARLRSQNGC